MVAVSMQCVGGADTRTGDEEKSEELHVSADGEQAVLPVTEPPGGAACPPSSAEPLSPGGRRMELSDELRLRALTLCREYLGGSWRSIQPQHIRVSVVR